MKFGQFEIDKFGDRFICIGRVGKMFYQDGFPVSMSVLELGKKGIDVSLFHVADECLKNGWSPETTIKKLSEDFMDDKSILFKHDKLTVFCNATYEDQREIIFQYLFEVTSKEALESKSVRDDKNLHYYLLNAMLEDKESNKELLTEFNRLLNDSTYN